MKFGFLSLQLLIFPTWIRSITEANEHSVSLNGEINSVSCSPILCIFPGYFSFSRLVFLVFVKKKSTHFCLVFKFFLAEPACKKQLSFLKGKDEVISWDKTPWLVHFVMWTAQIAYRNILLGKVMKNVGNFSKLLNIFYANY